MSGHDAEEDGSAEERDGIEAAHAVEQALDERRADAGEDDADGDADRGEDQALAQHEPEHAAFVGAERHADPNLSRAPAHGVRGHAVNADRREHEPDDAQAAGY